MGQSAEERDATSHLELRDWPQGRVIFELALKGGQRSSRSEHGTDPSGPARWVMGPRPHPQGWQASRRADGFLFGLLLLLRRTC